MELTHKSKTSFKTLDIMFKLPSRALNSTSWEEETAPHALIFWTASTTNGDYQHDHSGKGEATYRPCSEELGPVNIRQKLVPSRSVMLDERTYHGTRSYIGVEQITRDTFWGRNSRC